ncbi:hypothetical protein LOTGIDRAFT_237124 [Lottia gigantea]|uniref:Uncharacterized protein n=1 Tax=Lottia gigantea TaxID=225164 RepID=V4B1L2_LOTGI|nr:hypothetical protein LOTGIDRAFT_237124 [Lottia gigantea]ESO82129.1 hypothetical protein LOTGIDRAFT_237124 [Lottia gigantea]
MKTKNVNNAQEKCDEWLSTRNKKKISKPTPMIKKHSAALRLVKTGSSSKLCKLTQNSPPPPQIYTNTKQSVLMSYFTSKPDQSNEQSFDDLNEIDVDMQEDLTEQFGFLSQDESNEKEGHQNIPLSYTRVIKNDSAKCQVKCDIDASNDDNDDCKMSSGFKFSSNCKEKDIKVCVRNHSDDSDIDFVSQPDANENRNVKQKNYSEGIEMSNSKTDTDSDIEFISQCPEKARKYVNPPNSTSINAIEEHNYVENIRKTFSRGHKENGNSKTDTDSDIEFISQCPENVNPLESTGKLAINKHTCVENIEKTFSRDQKENGKSKTDTDSDIEFISQCPKTVEKYVNPPKSSLESKIIGYSIVEETSNKDRWKDKFQSDTSSDDIEFLSQCPEQKSKQLNAELSISNWKKHLNSKQCTSSIISEQDSDYSDIEFHSQFPEHGRYNQVIPKVPENSKELSRPVPKYYEKGCRHSPNSVKNLKLKCNKDAKKADNGLEWIPENSEIEFISQSVLQNPKTSSKFCDSVDSTKYFQNHTLNVTLNTEDLNTQHVQDFDFDSQDEDPCSSDMLQPDKQHSEEQCSEEQLQEHCQADIPEEQCLDQSLEEQTHQTDDLSFDSNTQADNNAYTLAEKPKQKQNKGGNSLRHKSRLLQKFLPDTIKFTDTESDSCEEPVQKTQPGNNIKQSSSLDSNLFIIEDSQPVNVHINRSRKKQRIDLNEQNDFDVS